LALRGDFFDLIDECHDVGEFVELFECIAQPGW
jgi:hypothetical protein